MERGPPGPAGVQGPPGPQDAVGPAQDKLSLEAKIIIGLIVVGLFMELVLKSCSWWRDFECC